MKLELVEIQKCPYRYYKYGIVVYRVPKDNKINTQVYLYSTGKWVGPTNRFWFTEAHEVSEVKAWQTIRRKERKMFMFRG